MIRKEMVDSRVDWIFFIILRPFEYISEEDPYYVYLAEAWMKFDKIPHRSMQGRGYDLPYFARLKREVIRPLGLNLNEY